MAIIGIVAVVLLEQRLEVVRDAGRARDLLATGVDAIATNEPRAIVAACADLLPS